MFDNAEESAPTFLVPTARSQRLELSNSPSVHRSVARSTLQLSGDEEHIVQRLIESGDDGEHMDHSDDKLTDTASVTVEPDEPAVPWLQEDLHQDDDASTSTLTTTKHWLQCTPELRESEEITQNPDDHTTTTQPAELKDEDPAAVKDEPQTTEVSCESQPAQTVIKPDRATPCSAINDARDDTALLPLVFTQLSLSFGAEQGLVKRTQKDLGKVNMEQWKVSDVVQFLEMQGYPSVAAAAAIKGVDGDLCYHEYPLPMIYFKQTCADIKANTGSCMCVQVACCG